MKNNISDYFIIGVGVFFIFTFIIIVIIGIIYETNNRITEGTVIDKEYHSAYTITEYSEFNDVWVPEITTHNATYFLLLRGQKNEVVVEYWLECTESEYNQYNIGDYYNR